MSNLNPIVINAKNRAPERHMYHIYNWAILFIIFPTKNMTTLCEKGCPNNLCVICIRSFLKHS